MLRFILTLMSSIVCGLVVVVAWKALGEPAVTNKEQVAMVLGFACCGVLGNVVNWFLSI